MSGQVKAFMSDAYSRLAHVCAVQAPHAAPVHIDEWLENDKALGAVTAVAAEREARMILEMTEPGTEGWGLLPFYTIQAFMARDGSARLCSGLLVGSEYGSVLAEALEAFVR